MGPTQFQKEIQNKLSNGKSLIIIAPTGLGKTFAVTGDLQISFNKTIYAVPLRALGGSIKKSISELKRNGEDIKVTLHHGKSQESLLFGEEVIVTTYDQIVCAVPGLPLSFPLKAGHAIAGATFMSRLILDEVHLAWGISKEALSILFGILDLRQKLNLQTVIITATLPEEIAQKIAYNFGLECLSVSDNDEGYRLREKNRHIIIKMIELKNSLFVDKKEQNLEPLYQKLFQTKGKSIYFANTVERIQHTYNKLIDELGMDKERILILHNRMSNEKREEIENKVINEYFGKDSTNQDLILLTNQVSEAGIDISANLVISDPAPVDVLIQRAGRCARWFRENEIQGEFFILKPPKQQLRELCLPYDTVLVQKAMDTISSDGKLDWAAEKKWLEEAWGGGPKDAQKKLDNMLYNTTFALNLFDRAAQNRRPGEIASVFREILSIEIAIADTSKQNEEYLQSQLDNKKWPETCSISLGQARNKLRELQRKGEVARVIRYVQDDIIISEADYLQLGDVLILPPTFAYFDKKKGLCYRNSEVEQAGLLSAWIEIEKNNKKIKELGFAQTLFEHSSNVMAKTYEKLTLEGAYKKALRKILPKIYDIDKQTEDLIEVVAQIAAIAAGFHDFGKSDEDWQSKAKRLCPEFPNELIGRTSQNIGRMGIPHTPPVYKAIIEAGELLVGTGEVIDSLLRTIALAATRHHSSFTNPSFQNRLFKPAPEVIDFLNQILKELNAPQEVIENSWRILDAAKEIPNVSSIPLLLPNADLFPIYALIGRAILLADREDASRKELERWRG